MKRIIVALILAGLLALATAVPAFAFVHVTIPVEDCANAGSGGNAGNNSTAGTAVTDAGLSPPLGGSKTTPDPCQP